MVFQGLTILMWGMSLATVMIKRRKLKLEFRALHDDLIPEDLSIGEDRSLGLGTARLDGLERRHQHVLARAAQRGDVVGHETAAAGGVVGRIAPRDDEHADGHDGVRAPRMLSYTPSNRADSVSQL